MAHARERGFCMAPPVGQPLLLTGFMASTNFKFIFFAIN